MDRGLRMDRTPIRVVLGVLVLLGWIPTGTGQVPVFPLEQVEPGLRGIAITVLSGAERDTLPVEVVGVYPGTSPGSHVILVRGEEELAHLGIAHGMSGSPVMVDGRVIGALAFAFNGAREAIGGVTPIGEMLRDMAPYFAQGSAPDGEREPGARRELLAEVAPFAEWRARCARGELWRDGIATPLSARAAPAGLEPLLLPIAWDGALGETAAWVGDALRRAGMTPVPAAGARTVAEAAAAATAGGTAPHGPGPGLMPGDAAAVKLLAGDMTAAAIGTVTWVDGDRVYAFGHPFTFTGSSALPFSRARIAAVIPTRGVSFKLGTATDEIGALVADKRTGVAARLGAQPEWMAYELTLGPSDDQPQTETYRYQVARHEFLAPALLAGASGAALTGRRFATGLSTLRSRIEIELDDGRRVEREDLFRTVNPAMTVAGEALAPATYLIANTYQRFPVRSVRLRLDLDDELRAEEITGLRVSQEKVAIGDEIEVVVALREHRGGQRERRAHLRIPSSVRSRDVLVLAGSAQAFFEWDQDRAPEKYRPQSLDDLIRLIETYPSEETLIIRLYGPSRGLVHQGRELASLPPSKWHTLGSGPTGGQTSIVNGTLLGDVTIRTGSVVLGGTYVRLHIDR